MKDALGVTHWTAANNVEPVEAPAEVLEARKREVEEWRARKDAEAAEAHNAIVRGERLAPERGSEVTIVDRGETLRGKVFWYGMTRTGGYRVGVKVDLGSINGEPGELTFWKSEAEVTVLAAPRPNVRMATYRGRRAA